MRDIEFRAKRTLDNQWVFGNLVIGLDNSAWASILRKADADQGQPFKEQEVDPETVGQYIGLQDNNEQKVFEGDIMQDSYDPDEIYIVSFMDGEFVLINDVNVIMDIEQVHFLSVIGNIHDNKEFFKSED